MADGSTTLDRQANIDKQLRTLKEMASKSSQRASVQAKSVRLRCPASSANLGPGFDIFALALTEPFDIVEVEVVERGIQLEVGGRYQHDVPRDVGENIAGFVAQRMAEAFSIKAGLRVFIEKNIKPAAGIGSSAASAMGVARAVDQIFGLRLSAPELIEWGALGEILSAGAAHADNVAAALLGGFVVVTTREPLNVVRYDPHGSLRVVIAVPNIKKENTLAARRILLPDSTTLTLSEAMLALQEACGIITGRVEDIIRATRQRSRVESRRESRGFFSYLEACKVLGTEFHAAVAGSGAGPAIVGLALERHAVPLATALRQAYESQGIACDTVVTKPSQDGISPCLEATQPSPHKMRRRAVQTEPIGPMADTLLKALGRLGEKPGHKDVERIVVSALETSGVSVVLASDRTEQGADLAIWVDDLDRWVGNPFLIEIKTVVEREEQVEAIVQQVSKYLEKSSTRWALVLYASGSARAFATSRAAMSTVLFLQVSELLERLRDSSFTDVIRQLRNQRIHGGGS